LKLAPAALPRRLRVAAFAVAVAVLLFLCLAPSRDLPPEHLWDKAEHGIAWFVLAGLGLLLAPWRPQTIVLFAVALGALVEVLQAAMPFGRDGDIRDLVADSIGVALAVLLWALVRRRLRRSVDAG
jgi:VanZ family protein